MGVARQATLEQMEYQLSCDRRVTRKARKLAVLGETTCWADLVAIVDPYRPKPGGRGRQPYPTETLLRMYFVQVWLNLSDEETEDVKRHIMPKFSDTLCQTTDPQKQGNLLSCIDESDVNDYGQSIAPFGRMRRPPLA